MSDSSTRRESQPVGVPVNGDERGAARDGGRPSAPPREVEFKFDLAPQRVDELLSLSTLSGFIVEPGELKLMADTYYDTPDLAWLRAGLALRVRDAANGFVLTVKGLAAEDVHGATARLEIECTLPLASDVLDPSTWSQAVHDEVGTLPGDGRPVEPLCHVEHARFLMAMRRDGDGERPWAELVLEKVVARSTDPALAAVRFATMELELVDAAQIAAFAEAGAALASLDGVRTSSKSKLERAFVEIAHQWYDGTFHQGVSSDTPVGEMFRMMWAEQLSALVWNEAGVVAGEDPEFVHDMRVALRRARAAAQILAPHVDERAELPMTLRRDMKRTARVLGAVRDLDVALERLAAYRQPLSARESAGLAPLERHWRRERKAARKRMKRWLRSKRYRALVAAWYRFSHATPATNGAAGPLVRDTMPGVILERFAVVRRYEGHVSTPDETPVETLHGLRIDCKQLRYALELVRPLTGRFGKRVIAQLKIVQDHLGELNDAAVAIDALALAPEKGVGTPEVLRYLALQEDIIRTLRARFPEVWEAFTGDKAREQLMRALARI